MRVGVGAGDCGWAPYLKIWFLGAVFCGFGPKIGLAAARVSHDQLTTNRTRDACGPTPHWPTPKAIMAHESWSMAAATLGGGEGEGVLAQPTRVKPT